MRLRSYIDDFLLAERTWDELCDLVERFLDACVYWNLSISVEKSVWDMPVLEYLGHKVDREGIRANPKNLDVLADLEFPKTVKAMQSLMGSLNYYSRFIGDFATLAAVLYEWKPTGSSTDPDADSDLRARTAFALLKQRLMEAPRLRHLDPDLPVVVAVYATEWSIAGALLQRYGDRYEPIRFTSHVLKKHERNYSAAEREILALLRILDVCYSQLAGHKILILTTHSTLGWLWRSHGLQGRLAIWAAILSGWDLEIQRGMSEVIEFLGIAAASVTHKNASAVLEWIVPNSVRSRRSKILAPIPGYHLRRMLLWLTLTDPRN